MLNFCKMFLITENSPSNKESTKLLQEKLSNIDYSRIKWYQMCGKIHFENYKYATYNVFKGARMSLTGVGCRLQTCSRLASERFNSAFCAILSLYIYFSNYANRKGKQFYAIHFLRKISPVS